jgi:Putative adhesin
MKKLLILLLGLTCTAHALTAQKIFKKAFSAASGKQKVEIYIESAELKISGYNGNELVIEADRNSDGPPERAKGLRPLSTTAEDNTGLGLEVKEAGGVMTIKKAMRSDASYKIKVPAGADIKIEEEGWNGGDLNLRDLNGEVEVSMNSSDIKIENVTGPVVANTVNGEIEVVFSRLNQEKPSHISATNGFIDVTLPADTKADVELHTINGEAYSDFDIKFPENEKTKGMKLVRNRGDSGKINGGGVELTLNAINDNVYLRKK